MDIPLFKVYMNPKVGEEVNKVLYSGFIGQGKKVEEFEDQLRKWFNTDRIVTLNSGTSGLHLALHMFKYGGYPPPMKVLTTSLTCFATNVPILANGYDIEWVDVDPDTLNMDLDDLARKITHDTKVIILTHWGGNPIELNKVEEICDKTYNKFGFTPKIIEDCAHSFGSTYMNKKLGNHGNICVYSLQAIKHVTAIDGGIMILPTIEQYKRAKLLRWYGIDRETPRKDMRCELDVEGFGYKFHMNDVNAVVGMCNLIDANDIIKKHRDNAIYYNKELRKIPGIRLVQKSSLANPSYWLYTILVEKRGDFVKYMHSKGIQVSRVHERNDIHSCVIPYRRHLPNLDRIMGKIICLPVGWWVTEKNREYIVDCIKKGW